MAERAQGAEGGELARAVRAQYHDTFELSEAGAARSVEVTTFEGVRWPAGAHASVGHLLQEAARLAASRYVERVQAMTLGVLGGVEGAPPGIYLRPFGLKLLEVMGFGELIVQASPQASLQDDDEGEVCGELSCGVERGLLASRHAAAGERGELVFRWRWQPGCEREVFETEVREYRPWLLGRGRWRVLRWLYRATQVQAHRVVMWAYHRWVRGARSALLLEASRALSEQEFEVLADSFQADSAHLHGGRARLTSGVPPT